MKEGDSVLVVNFTIGGTSQIYEGTIKKIEARQLFPDDSRVAANNYWVKLTKKYIDIRNGEKEDSLGKTLKIPETSVYENVNDLIETMGHKLIDWVFKVTD